MYVNHMNPRVEYVSARVRPKKENQKNEKTFVKTHLKVGLEKGMENVWENLRKVIQKGANIHKKTIKQSMRKKKKDFWVSRPATWSEPSAR